MFLYPINNVELNSQLIPLRKAITEIEKKLGIKNDLQDETASRVEVSQSHLEKKLHEKNLRIKELENSYQALQKEYGERGQKLRAMENDLNCAISNDFSSRKANNKLRHEIAKLIAENEELKRRNHAQYEKLLACEPKSLSLFLPI